MKRSLARSAVVCVLIMSLAVMLYGQSAPQSKTTNQFLRDPGTASPTKPNEKLRADVAKMIGETKAGRKGIPATSQFPTPQGNNLSKTAKIAIIAGIVIVVVAIIAVHSFKYDCKSRCVL